MSEWPAVSLGEIFEIARGGSPRPIQDFITDDPDGVNWIMIGDAPEGEKYITGTKKRIRKTGVRRSRMVHPGDFLLTNSMSFGRPYIMKTSGCIHDGWLVLSKKSGDVYPDYFYYLLGSNQTYAEFTRQAAGATVKNLNIDLVKAVKVRLPPIDEQRRIAAILDKADAIRRKRQQALALADDFLRSAFLEMFGDPVSNPKGWSLAEFKDICSRVTVGLVVRPASYYQEIGIPALRSLNVREERIELDDVKYFSEHDTVNKLAKSRVWKDDVVIVRSGQPGTSAVIPAHLDGANAIDILIATPRQELVAPRYLSAFLNSPAGRRLVLKEERGQIQKHLNVGSLNTAKVPLPPMEAQQSFIRLIEANERKRSRMMAAAQSDEALFASLSQRAFRGEL